MTPRTLAFVALFALVLVPALAWAVQLLTLAAWVMP